MKWFEPYSFAGCIIRPDVRWISGMMYHAITEKIGSKFQTLNCAHIGYCLGHKMSKKEFIEKYCDGIIPKEEGQ